MKRNHVRKTQGKKHKGSVAVEYMALTAFIGLSLIAGATLLGQAISAGMEGLVSSRDGSVLEPPSP